MSTPVSQLPERDQLNKDIVSIIKIPTTIIIIKIIIIIIMKVIVIVIINIIRLLICSLLIPYKVQGTQKDPLEKNYITSNLMALNNIFVAEM